MGDDVTKVIAAVAMSFAIAGCTVGGGSPAGNVGYWLVKVHGNNANVYPYPSSLPPWRSTDPSHALYLGPTLAHAKTYLRQAGEKMGIPLSHISYVSP